MDGMHDVLHVSQFSRKDNSSSSGGGGGDMRIEGRGELQIGQLIMCDVEQERPCVLLCGRCTMPRRDNLK